MKKYAFDKNDYLVEVNLEYCKSCYSMVHPKKGKCPKCGGNLDDIKKR